MQSVLININTREILQRGCGCDEVVQSTIVCGNVRTAITNAGIEATHVEVAHDNHICHSLRRREAIDEAASVLEVAIVQLQQIAISVDIRRTVFSTQAVRICRPLAGSALEMHWAIAGGASALLDHAAATLGMRSLTASKPSGLVSAAVGRAAALGAVDADVARRLLEEPWLSCLAGLVGSAASEQSASNTDGNPRERAFALAAALGAAAALCRAAASEEVGERSSRCIARLRTELLTSARIPTVLRHAEVSALGDTELTELLLREPRELDSTLEEHEPRRLLSRLCRALLALVTDDLTSCGILLMEYGALSVVLRVARADGGAHRSGVGASLAALSTASEFPAALEECPLPLLCALVDLAGVEVKRLGADPQPSNPAATPSHALGALLNACRVAAAPSLCRRLADRGAVSLLTGILQNRTLSLELRYESAEAICRLSMLDDSNAESVLPAAALQCIATPPTIAALVELAAGAEGNRRRSSFGDATLAFRASRELLRYRLPWLLACVARTAASADITAWLQDGTSIRSVIRDAFDAGRSRDVCAWGIDVLAALCGRLPPDTLAKFLQQGPEPLLDIWPVLLRADRWTIWTRAIVVGYYVASCLPHGPARRQLLGMLPVRGVAGQPPWRSGPGQSAESAEGKETPCLEGSQRQLAEVAVAAASVVTGALANAAGGDSVEGLVGEQWPMLFTVSRLVVAGLDALQALGWGQVSLASSRMGLEGKETVFLRWLQNALRRIGKMLEKVEAASDSDEQAHRGAQLWSEAAALFADVLDGPLRWRQDNVEESGTEDDPNLVPAKQPETTPGSDLQRTMQREVIGLLELALLSSKLYPDLEADLAANVSSSDLASCHFMDTIGHTPLVSLATATRSLGRLEYGRLLIRLLLRALSEPVAGGAATQRSLDESGLALASARDVLLDASADAEWGALPYSQVDLDSLDSFVAGGSLERSSPQVPFGGGKVLRAWVGSLLTTRSGGFFGFRSVLHFLDQVHTSGSWPEQRLLLTAAVLERLAPNAPHLAQRGLGTCVQVIEAVVRVASASLKGAAAFGTAERGLAAQIGVVELLTSAVRLSGGCWRASTMAEVFAYLWAALHVAGNGLPGAADENLEGQHRWRLWTLASSLLDTLLSTQQVINSICQSDDNASVLPQIRWALGPVGGALPIFARKGILAAHEQEDHRLDVMDLFEESWCPPGRVLLGAVPRLASWVLATKRLEMRPIGADKLLAAALAGAARVVATVARPANLFHSASDVFALLETASAIIKDPPGSYATSWRCLAGTLLVPLLHRPPIEAILAPHDALGAIKQVPHGLAALQWCAKADTEAGLGSWGARARAILTSHEDRGPVLSISDFVASDEEHRPAAAEQESTAAALPAARPLPVPPPKVAATTRDAVVDRGVPAVLLAADQPERLGSGVAISTAHAGVPSPGAVVGTTADHRADLDGGKRAVAPSRSTKEADSPSSSFSQLAAALSGQTATSSEERDKEALCSDMLKAMGALSKPITNQPKSKTGRLSAQFINSEELHAEALRLEVAALEAELGSIDAELDAELAELQDELDDDDHTVTATVPHADAACGASTPPDSEGDEQSQPGNHVVAAFSDRLNAFSDRLQLAADSLESVQTIGGSAPSASSKTLLRRDASQAGAVSLEGLSHAASSFLSALLGASETVDAPEGNGLAEARDGVLNLLVNARRHGHSVAAFQADAMLQVYSAHYADLPNGGDVRAALRYLFENLPTDWRSDPPARVFYDQAPSSSEDEPGAEPCVEDGPHVGSRHAVLEEMD